MNEKKNLFILELDLQVTLYIFDIEPFVATKTCIQSLLLELIFTSAIFGWICFYGISIILGYSVPNPVFTYIFNIRFVIHFVDTVK